MTLVLEGAFWLGNQVYNDRIRNLYIIDKQLTKMLTWSTKTRWIRLNVLAFITRFLKNSISLYEQPKCKVV